MATSPADKAEASAEAVTEDLRDGSQALRDTVDRLRSDLDDLRHQLVAAGGEQASAARTAVARRVEELRNELEEVAGGLERRGRETAASLGAQVREHPVASLAIAFGAGMVAARLLERR